MKMIKHSLIAVLCCLVFSSANAGFIDGQDYDLLNYSQRLNYVAGVIDTIEVMDLVSANPNYDALSSFISKLNTCTKPMKLGQVVAIVDKYHDANPERWHEPMSALIHLAIDNACK